MKPVHRDTVTEGMGESMSNGHKCHFGRMEYFLDGWW